MTNESTSGEAPSRLGRRLGLPEATVLALAAMLGAGVQRRSRSCVAGSASSAPPRLGVVVVVSGLLIAQLATI